MSHLREYLFAFLDRSVRACFISKGKFFAAGLCAQMSSCQGPCKAAGGPWGPGHTHPVPLPAAGPSLPHVPTSSAVPHLRGAPRHLAAVWFSPTCSPRSSACCAEASSTSWSGGGAWPQRVLSFPSLQPGCPVPLRAGLHQRLRSPFGISSPCDRCRELGNTLET